MDSLNLRKVKSGSALFDPKIVWPAVGAAFAKLDPRLQIKNPVMFVVEVVAALTTLTLHPRSVYRGGPVSASPFKSFCGFGSRCCLRTLRKRLRKAGVRRRQPLSADQGEAFRQADHG